MTTLSTRRLTPTDWAHIVTMFERGEKNIRELAEQFGVSSQAIHKGLKSRGIKKGSRLSEVTGDIDNAAREERERRVKQANQQVESYAKWYDVIAKLTMKKVIEGSQTPGGIAAHNADLLALKNATGIVEKARNESWAILGIEDLLGENAELPDLNVGEYTPEELERIREANEESYLETLDDGHEYDQDDEDFEGDDEDYEGDEEEPEEG